MIWLVAEDEADIRVLITTMIQVWGHQTAAFENGQKVWDWLDKLEADGSTIQPPELVLMDIRMPGKKGNEVAARMRALSALRQTPIVLMTAFSMTEAERMELLTRDGADLVIQKPLPDFDQLRKPEVPDAPTLPETPETPAELAPVVEKASVPKSL